MATVHPSRMGLVPAGSSRASAPTNGEGSNSREEELRRKLMDRKRGGDDKRDRDGDRDERRDRDRSRDRDERRERDGDGGRKDRDRDRARDRDGEGFRSYESRRDERDRRDRDRDRDRDGGRRRSVDRERERDDRPRRASPSYNAYDANAPPPPSGNGAGYGYGRRDDLPSGPPGMPPPWVPKMQSSQKPNWQNPPPHQRFGNMDLERRRQERENNPLSIWPESPKRPYQDEDELEAERKKNKSKSKSSKHKSKSKSSKHKSPKHRSSKRYSDESSSETDSEEEERRRRRRKEKERERRKRYDSESVSDSEERRRKRRRSTAGDEEEKEEDLADQWVEKGGEVVLIPSEKDKQKIESHYYKSPEKVVQKKLENESDDEEIGPQLPTEAKEKGMDRSAFAHMRPGEGEAMALYAESGQRIPRRGEIGMEASTIEKFEQSGYVMSGSRHQRMNAVRMRKENQVINEAEKRAILKLQREEKEKKEGMIITQFKEMMEENLRKQGINRP
ncbi:hypothetical protein L486_01612 [Kwoniella mangroviensis CBS 10435]|uniref:NF-kappa-B-activating protein C-terminal domain-containing protein n=1 Tax=Kwoniella mangroviensis CBS 10435 TaxID=1331196 RepID=A0A1B9J2D0_9TREE|nr:hypothetical protein L486_01612 [Kwoniella mangroviensis CBS 10435]